MKSNGSARALLPASGRTVVASPLASSPSFSGRMSPTSSKKRRGSVATDKSHASGAVSGHSSSRTVSSPAQEGFAYGMDAMMAAPTNMIPPSHEFLYQLQHMHQQQQGMAAAVAAYGYPGTGIQPMAAGFAPQYMAPPMMPRAASSSAMAAAAPPMHDDLAARSFSSTHSATNAFAPSAVNATSESVATALPSVVSSGDEDAANLMQRLEKKDQMINQLGSFLSQMKHESEGTANAWKEKLQEISELKRQLATATQQLESVRESEHDTAVQLEHARQEISAAMDVQHASEQTHIEEIKIMHDEIKKCQSEADHMKVGYEQSLKDVSHELLESQQKQQEATAQCRTLKDALENIEAGHHAALAQLDDERSELQLSLERMSSHLESVNREKQDLGQHLWNVTQELQQSKQRESELERKCAAVASELENAQSAWSERFHHFQSEKAEQLGAHSMLQTQLQDLDAKFQSERAQKEELNAMMVRELQRFHDEVAQLEQSQIQTLEHALDDTTQWKSQTLALEDKLTHTKSELASAVAELDELRARVAKVDEENQFLQQNGSEKASTLQELNNQLRGVMGELEDTQSRYEQLHAVWERHESSVAKCLQLLSVTASSSSSAVPAADRDRSLADAFPASIVSALEDYVQLSSASAEMKIAVLRAQQELDSDRERCRQREQELQTQTQSLQSELDATRADAKTLAHELQQLSRQSGGNESKLAAQVQQLAKELDDLRNASGLQALQLQKSLDSQRARTAQLESEKKDLLQEAEQLNASMETLYQAKNAKQLELDQLRATWKELELEHSDLKESFEDLDERTARTITELNAKLKELQSHAQSQRAASSALQSDHDRVLAQLSSAQSECESLAQRFATEQSKWSAKEQELGTVLEDKTHRMDEMLAVLTQLQTKSEFLEKSRASDDASMRLELERYQQQLLTLTQDKKRLELAYSSLKAQHEQVAAEAAVLREDKRVALAQQSESDDALTALQREVTRLQGELERATRAKASLQAELHRVGDDAQDALRQLEVVRRDARAQESHWQSELERASKDADDARAESSDAHALVEELQSKMTSLQSAANATINDLVAELQNAQETLAFDKGRTQKELETLRAQLTSVDDTLRRKEQELQALQTAARADKEQSASRESELALRLSRATTALEQKKHEIETLGKELEAKTLRAAECERKLAPLAHVKESLQQKSSELKQRLDTATRDAHALEQRLRDDFARASKDKREAEALCAAAKDELDAARALAQQQQQQWQSDCRALRQNLERAKSDAARASSETLALAQRLEACQQAANETIADLSARLDAADQQRETALSALQRELQLERERRREAEVQKMELQRLVRQRGGNTVGGGGSTSGSAHGSALLPVAAMSDRTSAWSSSGGALESESVPPPKSAQPAVGSASVAGQSASSVSASGMTKARGSDLSMSSVSGEGGSGGDGAQSEIRKFYANEPMTNAELSNLPMALIKAQLGLDLSSASATTTTTGSSSLHKSSSVVRGSALSNARQHHQQYQENNDDIPPLPLEKLPQNPEADSSEVSPSCGSESGRARDLGSSSAAQYQLAALSSRSTERSFLLDSTDGRNRLSAVAGSSSSLSLSSGKSAASGNNNKKTLSSKKKRLPASSSSSSNAAAAGLASAYASFGTLPSASAAAHAAAVTVSPHKSKSTSKLLPRIP